jgi:hypothetical protein
MNKLTLIIITFIISISFIASIKSSKQCTEDGPSCVDGFICCHVSKENHQWFGKDICHKVTKEDEVCCDEGVSACLDTGKSFLQENLRELEY